MLKKIIEQLKTPQHLTDLVGQEHLLGTNGLLARMVDKKYATNLIMHGPPGVGKSSFARVLAANLNIPFQFFNPVLDSKKDLLNIIEVAKLSQQYIIVVDEIHRLNKDKQDILLPLIESNKIIIFATTTENPFFAINAALRSRCQLLAFHPIKPTSIQQRLTNLFNPHTYFEPQAFDYLIQQTNGDLRAIINILEIISVLYSEPTPINLALLTQIMGGSYSLGHRDGNEIHDLKSAFHKSLRGSDIDAGLYYLARLIRIGDFDAIYRRMLVCVYEDVGLANINLCARVDQGISSCRYLGYPENEKILANLVIQICMSPKSNASYLAYNAVLMSLEEQGEHNVPNHLRDAHYASAVKLGVKGYLYPHDFPQHYIEQDYLPKQIKHQKFYFGQKNDLEEKLNIIHQSFTKRKK
ncbi:replication-associated recombination protein A [Ureaplasma miroungigenitalium]|uniref:Replication-associated recombination protein A n=1 Tax=Ureaplasma miroungigenitalium TaxID=1042321 RepID=A0ABT3BN34_9BACT|nr:replication-associated recombination protein A [Ureaplasma miroungigenitalium]MCV3728648.1 replication-associated recombination protein A [Ureaplasma miroungigenitalium]